jgi:serine/threonine protein kinase
MPDPGWIPDPHSDGTDPLTASASTPPSEFAVASGPAQVPGFTLLRPLGRGGMAVVYEAEQQLLGRRVALKLIRPGSQGDMQAMERFMREARAVAAVSHPRVLGVHEVGYAGGQMFMALELCPGGTLKDLLNRQGPLAEDHALGLLAEVCDGLAAIHRAGLIHRDIKPANILLAADGSVRVGDLGLAYRHGDEHMTATGCQVGTPAYMPPEQIAGDSELDARIDLYAVGGTLFTLLTGRPPFRGSTDFMVTHRALAGEIPDLAGLAPVRPATVAMFRALMAPDRRQRYADAAVVAADLRLIIAGREPEHLPGQAAAPASATQHPKLLLAGALIAAGLAAGIIAWLLLADPSRPQPPVAPAPPAPLPIEPPRPPGIRREAAQQEASVCRARLARLDDPVPLRQRQLEALARDLATLAGSLPDDPGLGRWRLRLDSEAGRLAALRDRLAGLDRAAPAEADLASLGADLADYLRRVDPEDAAGARWSATLHRATIASGERQGERSAILARCAILSQPANPGAAALDALGRDLQRLAALGGGDEAARLGEHLARHQGDLAGLRNRLAALDATAVPSGQELAALRSDLTRFAALAAPGDPAVLRWHGRIRELDTPRPAVPAPTPPPPPATDPAPGPTAGPAPPAIEPPPAWAAASGRDASGRWAELHLAGTVCRFRLVGTGSFTMGPGAGADDRAHQVTLSRAFWLAETECTQGFWRAVTGEAAPGSPRGAHQPVTDVNWVEATAFIADLRRAAPQLAARLPSEAEWEWAVRSGTSLPSWTKDNAGGAPHPVAQSAADALGCFDLLGNVWEWCADAHRPYPSTAVTDPPPPPGERRVIRGGGYASPAGAATATMRGSLGADHRQPFVGFRLAADGP